MRRLRILIVLASLVAAAAAFGQAVTAPPAKHILHEDLPPPAGAQDDSPVIGDTPRSGKNPAAFASGDKVLPEPSGDTPKDAPVLGRGGFGADRDTQTRPDEKTSKDGTLHYVSVFNPDVLPFKRMTALDTVLADYTMGIVSTAETDLEVGGHTDPSRDRFWGDVEVDLEPGKEAPLPSVAPDMRILSYETTPPVPLVFSKDGADNFSVRSDESSVHGTYRLVFLVDADAGYFAPAFPAHGYTLDEVRRQAQRQGLLPDLPTGVEREAKVSLRHLHIDPGDDLTRAFNTLVYYFRGFEAKPMTDTSGNVYRDLFDNQAGVCRHRSFAFLVTALAAGIPTRYVTNEAHAFVEVWFPDRGWQRVDLGGAALEMDVQGADGKTLHRPRHDDPFDKPPEYDQSYTQLKGDISGLTDQQLSERRAPLGDSSSGDFEPLVDGSGSGSGSGNGLGDDAVQPGADAHARPRDPKKLSPEITITLSDNVGYRGEPLEVQGRVDAEQKPVAGQRVDLFLAPIGRGGDGGHLIGRGATDDTGKFVVEAQLPPDLDLETYELYATTPESDQYNAGVSQ